MVPYLSCTIQGYLYVLLDACWDEVHDSWSKESTDLPDHQYRFRETVSRSRGYCIHKMPTILIVGASRGLGNELAKKYAAGEENTVIATSRSEKDESSSTPASIRWIPVIDVSSEAAGVKLATSCKNSGPFDVVIITAGYFGTETFDQPKWDEEVKMYTTSAIGPVFIVHHLVKAGLVSQGAKIILVSSESGSITLRHESEGGGNFGHHASKAALNMVGKLLSLDLKDQGIAVGIVHVSTPSLDILMIPE